MRKVYVIRKYVIAESAEEAIKKSKRAPIDDCWADDSSTQEVLKKEIQRLNNKGVGFK